MKIVFTLLSIIMVALFWDAGFHIIRGLLNLFPVLIWFAFLLIVANSWFFSTVAISSIVAVLYSLSSLKLKVWHQPITPADLHYLKSIGDLRGVFETYTNPYIVAGIVLAFLSLIVWYYRKKVDKERDRFLRYPRNGRGLFQRLLIIAAISAVLAVWIGQVIGYKSPLHRIYHDFSVKHGVSRLKWSLKENGFFTYFITQLPLFEIQIPSFDLARGSVRLSPLIRGKADGPSVLPDILVWVNESTFDPSYLNLDSQGLRSFSMFQEHPATIASGLLNVHAFGGRTWITEFGFFAGIPPYIFGPSGSCAPYTLVPRLKEALGTYLRSKGYRTVAFNPVSGRFMDAASAYKHYGFDEFYDPQKLGHNDPHSWHIPDEFFKEQTIRLIQGHAGPMPLFLVVLTMGNHGPHPQKNGPERTSFQGPGLTANTAQALSAYLARLQETDKAIEALSLYLMGRARPTIFLYFGDHLPAFTDEMPDELFDTTRGADKMKTTFHIRTNYPVERPMVPQILDVSYLSGLLLDVARLNDSPFFQFNAFMRNYLQGKMIMQGNPDLYVNSYVAQMVNQITQ